MQEEEERSVSTEFGFLTAYRWKWIARRVRQLVDRLSNLSHRHLGKVERGRAEKKGGRKDIKAKRGERSKEKRKIYIHPISLSK